MFGVIKYTGKATSNPAGLSSGSSKQPGFQQKKVHLNRFVGPTFRSALGCVGCRKRRKKCDETHPACNACVKRKLPCVWREKGRNFGNESADPKRKRVGNEVEGNRAISLRHLGLEINEKSESRRICHETEEYEASYDNISDLVSEQASSNEISEIDITPKTTNSPLEMLQIEDLLNSELVEISAGESTVLDLESNCIVSKSTQPVLLSPRSSSNPLTLEFSPFLLSFFSLFLDNKGASFVQHFEQKVSGVLTVSPSKSNYFTKTFLLLASVNEGIGHAIASWGAFYLHQEDHADVQTHLRKAMALTAEKFPRGTTVSRYDYFTLLCFHLIMMGFFVCQGDVSEWRVCFRKCHELIMRFGGLSALCQEFDNSNDIKFMLSNFFYHDVTSSASFANGTIIPVSEYTLLFKPGYFDKSYGIDPLQGCLNPLYMLMAEEHEVKRDMKVRRKRLEDLLNGEQNMDNPIVQSELNLMRMLYLEFCELVVKDIATKIDQCKIAEGLELNEEEFELHLRVFFMFLLVCKLYWALHIKGMPSTANETQLISMRLIDGIERLLDTRMIIVLCLPILTAGSACYTENDRNRLRKVVDGVISTCPIRNVKRAWVLVQEVWRRNPAGHTLVDWADVCEEFGWDLCVC